MDYLIGNRNGIIGNITIIEENDKKHAIFCSFENNFLQRNPFDPE